MAIKKLTQKLTSELKNLELLAQSFFSKGKDKVENEVPYVSQFAHPEYAEKILKDNVSETSDPDWRKTGAVSVDEYARWVLTTCGMACTAMALRFFNDQPVEVITLAKDALTHDVYKVDGSELSSMHYREYADWVKKYRLKAVVYSRLSIAGIQKLLSSGHLVIVSVNPNVRGFETANNKQKGGHLVLLTGYNKLTKTITLHNPSGFVSNNSQVNQTLSTGDFISHYAGRGISLAFQ